MSFLSVRRCAHVCHALVLAAVLLAGQRNVLGEVVAGAAAASQEAVDSKVGVARVVGNVWGVHGGDWGMKEEGSRPGCRPRIVAELLFPR